MSSALSAGLLWDAHSNLPLETGRPLDDLVAHRQQGFGFVSLNIGYDPAPLEQILRAVAGYREALRTDERFALVRTVAELDAAAEAGRLAVAFDLEGALPLLGEPSMAALWSSLGVRQMHLAYNRNNGAAGGCYDDPQPLTTAGRDLVRALNTAGIVVDCSHGGERSTLDIMDCSGRPVVFSHACVAALNPHPRNLSDRQIDACAATDGVIGIVGYSRFLGRTPSTAEDMVRHMRYIAERVGPRHVGIGWDYGYPAHGPDPMACVDHFDWWFPDASRNRAEGLSPAQVFTPLTEAPRLGPLLAQAGFDSGEVAGILGGNFRRVAQACWPAS